MRWHSALDVISYDESYYEYLQLAHRRPTYQNSAPAITWHIAFWWGNSDQNASRGRSDGSNLRTLVEDNLNPFLRNLQTSFSIRPDDDPDHSLREFTYKPTRGGRGVEMVWPYSLNFTLRWGEVIVRCVVSYSSYFCTFTFIVDLETSIRNRNSSLPEPTIDSLTAALRDSLHRVSSAYQDAAPEQKFSSGVTWRDDKPSKEESTSATFIFANFWASFGHAIRERLGISQPDSIFPGHIFADFRGMIARIDPSWDAIAEADTSMRVAIEEERRDLTLERKQFCDVEARWTLSAIWPLFKASSPGIDTDTKRKDSIACLMLDRQVLYLSSLGAHEDFDIAQRFLRSHGEGPAFSAAEAYPPVCFFMLLKARPNRRQLGRLIERINNLGTLRLAALRDFSAFREISSDLRQFGEELDEISSDLIHISQKISQQRVETADEMASYEQWMIENRLTELATKINESSNKVQGGIHNRAARTRIIVNSFKQRVEDLRINRIEFWQPYDEFVRRTLFETYDFVMSVDERMQTLRNRLRQVLTGVQTTALVDLTTGIRDLNDDTNKLTEGILKVERSAGNLQIILFIIGVAAFFGELAGALIQSAPWLFDYVPFFGDYFGYKEGVESDIIVHNMDRIASVGKIVGYVVGFVAAVVLYPSFALFSDWLFRRENSKGK